MGDTQSRVLQWTLFYNASGKTIPAYGVFKADQDSVVDDNTDEIAINAVLPDGSGQYFLNGPIDVPSGSYGECGLPAENLMFAAYDGQPSDLTAWTTRLGPKKGDSNPFFMRTDGDNNFIYSGYFDSSQKIIKVLYNPPTVIPYIVTEVQSDPKFGIGENVSIDNQYGTNLQNGNKNRKLQGTFEAKPYKEGVSYTESLDGKPIQVLSRMIPTVLFTGQMFLFSKSAELPPGDGKGDVVSSLTGNRFYGNYVKDQNGDTNIVDVAFQTKLKAKSANRDSQCRVQCANGTDGQLVAGQGVIADYMATGISLNLTRGQQYNRWRISEYECVGV